MQNSRIATACCLLLIVGCLSVPAQTVPSQMKLGELKLNITENTRKQIQKDVDRLTQSQTYFNILVDRMNLYFPIIAREHRAAGIPEQIKFLAIQESALISDAVSSANAVGFWQFKDFTAREVGLRVDRSVDERLNIVASSAGSAKYLKSHQFFLKNWIYSVMAYNTGRGGAEKYVERSNMGVSRMTINNKTHWYVKKFIAHVVAFSPAVGRPHSEGIWLDELTQVGGKTLEQIAKEQKVDLEELKDYNKWLKRGAVPKDKTFTVLIPRKGTRPKRPVAGSQTNRNERSEPEKKIYPTEIKPGITKANAFKIVSLNGVSAVLAREKDDVHSLSARIGISEKKFRKINDLQSNQDISADQFYYMKKKKSKARVRFHVVAAGESLWSISQQYGIRLTHLAKKNRLSTDEEVTPGRVLWMQKVRPSDEPIAYHQAPLAATTTSETDSKSSPKSTPSDEATSNKKVPNIIVPVVDTKEERLKKVKIHTIAAGETLWSISKLYEVKTEDLLRWNHLPDPNAIAVGQNIQVKAPIEEASKAKNILSHEVQPGETVYGISRKYGMTVDEVVDLNSLKGFDLDAGQVLKVYGTDKE